MIYDYDTYLSDLAEEYNTSCEPKVTAIHFDYAGEGEYDCIPLYNCENCDIEECENWKKFN